MGRTRALAVAGFAGLAAVAAGRSEGEGDLLNTGQLHIETGYLELIHRTGASLPTGAGVIVAHSEPDSNPGYKVDPSDPEFAAKSFLYYGGKSVFTNHAQLAGQHFYGLATGVAPGPTEVHNYWAADLIGKVLHGASPQLPEPVPWKVIKNGAAAGSGPLANVILRKLDYASSAHGVLAVQGQGNNATLPMAGSPLYAHVFSGITVGRSDGNHRRGPTLASYDGGGRLKPEIVGPQAATSYSASLVSGASVVLVETARTHSNLLGNANAERPVALKAMILAGAEHRPGWDNAAPASGPSRGLTAQPLDLVYGVDELDINHSHWICTGGEHDGASTPGIAADTRHNGWDLMTLPQGESRYWRFQVENPKPFASVVVTWNRAVSSDFQTWEMPEIDLELHRVDAQGSTTTLIGAPGLPYFASGNVRSESAIDNVEHLFVRDLQPGEYLLEVERNPDGLTDFEAAVAWELNCSEPFTYGTAKTTSSGRVPTMGWRGIPSAAENDFEISITDAEPNKNGVFFFGAGPKNIPFKGGFLLVQGPLKRTPLLTTDAAGAVTLPIALDPSLIGEQRNYQFWFRDPGAPKPYGLSDAIEIVFCP